MRYFTRYSAIVAFLLIGSGLAPVSGLQGVPGGGKDNEDPLVAAMKFARVPKGTFWAGYSSLSKKYIESEIKDDFEIAAYTVTQEQWQALMGTNPSWFSRTGGGKDLVKDISDADLKRFPVEQVSWDDAQEFVKKLNDREKGKGWVYRLPLEEEWEFACRGAVTSKEDCSFDFYFDKPTNALSSKQANFNGASPAGNAEAGPYLARTTKVGSYAPNKLGLYDMHANVWQWCANLYDAAGEERTLRGGAWGLDCRFCAAGSRHWMGPSMRDNYNGFRLVRDRPSGK